MTYEKKRMVHYDLLRIIAAFSVVMLHSAAQFWDSLDIASLEWKVADGYNAVSRFGVPIFVMLSGALLLPEQYKLDMRKLYVHNILRLAAAYVFWSCMYGLLDCWFFGFSVIGWKDVFREMLYGRYHLWFLPMLIGIYMLLPILRIWVHNAQKKNLQYFLLLFFVLKILVQTVKEIWPSNMLAYALSLTEIELACGYVGYFILGYYIAHIGICPKYHKLLYIGAAPSAALNVVLGNLLSVQANAPTGGIYDSFGLFTFWIVCAIFLFFTEVMSRVQYSSRAERLIRELSMGTMGVYMMHIGVMEILSERGVHSMMVPNAVGIPLCAALCFLICLCMAMFLRRLPFIGKYIF